MSSPEIVSIVGARPQFVKAAVVSRAFAAIGIGEVVIHTGQHYDEAMSGRFLTDLGMKNVAANLAVGSGSHAHQTARIMTGLQDYLDAQPHQPKAIVVYGDTNSTVAAGLVAAKLGIALMHVEAGLRSYNRAMPEEINRVVVDHLSSQLFCSSEAGVENLAKEGITRNVHDVGDVMLDAFRHFSRLAPASTDASVLPPAGEKFALVTIHRPSNTDDSERLGAIAAALGETGLPCVWPIHPRLQVRLEAMRLPPNVRCLPPVGYLEMLLLLDRTSVVVTDSGGLQKEAYWAKRTCVTLRSETEWVETLDDGWNVLAEPTGAAFQAAVRRRPPASWKELYGDGKASARIAEQIAAHVRSAN